MYVTNGFYADHLEPWLKEFTLDQMIFIESTQLVETPWLVAQQCERAMGLDHEITEERNFVFNEEKGRRMNPIISVWQFI